MLIGVLFCVVLCVVRASVMINIFDDDVNAVKSSINSCNLRWCEQQCRRMGFPGGVCVGDRCKCDILQDNAVDQKLSAQDCSPLDCDKICRRIGYPGGACVNNKCKCGIRKLTEQESSQPPVDACLISQCNQQCRDFGYARGVCIGNQCMCINSNAKDIAIPLAATGDNCIQVLCDQRCRRMGYLRGQCQNGRCICHVFSSEAFEELRDNIMIPEDEKRRKN